MADVGQQRDPWLTELGEAECWALLGSGSVGRVGFRDDQGPVVLPVNYVVEGKAVLFATAAYTSMARHLLDESVAFEVDATELETHSGWSVLVRGRAAFVDYEDLPDDAAGRPKPWPRGPRTLFVRITPTSVTGRRLGTAPG
jgi:nitroimidazol reductase NimA-like FMN-containing flavoprotein (pyridoxamine 5'-phosphate oxidase superfamily)